MYEIIGRIVVFLVAFVASVFLFLSACFIPFYIGSLICKRKGHKWDNEEGNFVGRRDCLRCSLQQKRVSDCGIVTWKNL